MSDFGGDDRARRSSHARFRPLELAKQIPKNTLLTESEWRGYGVTQSRGWVHYAIHKPEPHILLFRRPLSMST